MERTEITSAAQLESVIGKPITRVAEKVRPELDPIDVAFIGHSPFLLMATSDADGRCDVSPKGDPTGSLALVLDAHTLAVPERPGNRRVDGYHNIMANPHVGLIFLVPGRGDTLRVNGRARLVGAAPYFDDMQVKGHRPILALEVDVEEVFYHCAKAFLRSELWEPQTWNPGALPSRATIAGTLERPDMTIEQLEEYYGPGYADRIYQEGAVPQPTTT